MTHPPFPDYGRSILSLITSVLKYYGVPTPYDSLPELDQVLQKKYKNVVLMVFDAMGSAVLKKHLPAKSFLRTHQKATVSSVFPPTTAAAMTVFYAGVPPIVSGWLSSMCYFKEYDRVITLYGNQDFYTGETLAIPPVRDFLRFESVYTQIEKATAARVQTTELSPFNSTQIQSVSESCEKIIQLCAREQPQFILSYWPEPDAAMHAGGTACEKAKKILLETEEAVQKLSAALSDTLLIVTADHGHIDLEEEIYIDDYPLLKNMLRHPLSFEDRVVSVFVKEAFYGQFKPMMETLFPNEFLVLEKEQVLAEHLFGIGPQHPKVDEFLGDFLVVSVGSKSLRQKGTRVFPALRGSHAGLKKEEREVPLILIEKK